MSSYCQRSMDSMIFDSVLTTTTREDFTGNPNKPYDPTEIKKRTFARMIRPSCLHYQHTLEQWKRPAHFALYLKRKEIVNTNPWEVQKTFTKQRDEQLKQVVRTRPRIRTFAPAVSMDDIPEGSRDIIVDSIYKSSQMATEEAVKGRNLNVCSTINPSNPCPPYPDLPAPAQPIPRLIVQPAAYVSPEWRKDSVTWDSRQRRIYCDPTEHFWLHRDKGKTVK